VLVPTVVLIALSSTFVGLFVAVAVSEVFEAQTFSNFLRFPMIFLCGLFFPIEKLPWVIRPLSYALPLTYGVDAMRGAIGEARGLPLAVDLPVLAVFCVGLFMLSLRDIRQKWIL
jgi:ABC-2 type transport system permease protein